MMAEQAQGTTSHELTPRQRVVVHLAGSLANDLDRGNRAEQHTAALLRLVADAVSRSYAGELVVVAREWAREREAGVMAQVEG